MNEKTTTIARIDLELTCLTDVAVSASAGSVGAHEALGYVPGSQLLGSVAATLYERLLATDRAACWRTFHAGAVRFGAAYPVASPQARTYPAPLSWHHGKDVALSGERLEPQRIENLAAADATWRPRLKQLRTGYVDRYGRWVRPTFKESLRTAVDPETGRARTGLLYELNAIAAGTRLLARIEADEERLLGPVCEALFARGGDEVEVVLGRSRRAELGRVALRRLDKPPLDFERVADPPRHEALFWCVSDLAWRDEHSGQPALIPPPEALGLPSTWRYVPERSFVRTRRYSPFNGHRRRPDFERQVLVGGSVLVYAGETPCQPERVDGAIARGIGEARGEGLGRLLYAPACLLEARPVFADPAEPGPSAPTPAPRPESALIDWLETAHEHEKRAKAAWRKALAWRKEIAGSSGWRALSPSQWFALEQALAAAPAGPNATLEAFEAFTGGSMRKLPDRWGARRRTDRKVLSDWLADEVALAQRDPELGPTGARLALMELTRLMARAARRPERSVVGVGEERA